MPLVAARSPHRLAAPLAQMLVGALSAASLHLAAVEASDPLPPGWRVTQSAIPVPLVHGPTRSPATWALAQGEMWSARPALAPAGARSLNVDADLGPSGQLTVWLARRPDAGPGNGDLLLQLDRQEGGSARLLAWGHDGPRPIACAPRLSLPATDPVHIETKSEEGVVTLSLNGTSSVCAALMGDQPPALEAGAHRVRVSHLVRDGRPTPAPSPGPMLLWAVLGALSSLVVGRLEAATGASRATTFIGDTLQLAGALLAAQLLTHGLGSPAWVVGTVLWTGLLRVTIHVGRALRPVPGPDWEMTPMVAAAVPLLGLLALSTASMPLPPWGLLGAGALAVTLACWSALHRRSRPRRAITLVLGVVSASTFLARLVGGSDLHSLVGGALAGLGSVLFAASVTRANRHRAARFIGAVAALVIVIISGELSIPIPDGPDGYVAVGQAPIPPLPPARPGEVLVVGGHSQHRGDRFQPLVQQRIQEAFGTRAHPVGDTNWTPEDVLHSLQSGGQAPRGTTLLLLQQSSPAPTGPLDPRHAVLPGLQRQWRAWTSRVTPLHAADQLRVLGQIADAFAQSSGRLVLVTPPIRRDPAFSETLRMVSAAAAQDHPTLIHVDLARAAYQAPDGGWTDEHGLLTVHSWRAVALAVQSSPLPAEP